MMTEKTEIKTWKKKDGMKRSEYKKEKRQDLTWELERKDLNKWRKNENGHKLTIENKKERKVTKKEKKECTRKGGNNITNVTVSRKETKSQKS